MKPTDIDHITAARISLNSGDDLAGVIHSIGSEVAKTAEWRVGDRVAAFHPMGTEHGAYAEFAVSHASTVVRLPLGIDFEGKEFLLLCFRCFGAGTVRERATSVILILNLAGLLLADRGLISVSIAASLRIGTTPFYDSP